MKKLINNIDDIVTEMTKGVVVSSNGKLKKLDDYNVVIRTNVNNENVALISGGGSGHEPAHAGFVGTGMLTAAVCGEVFTSPTPDAVLSAIKAANSKQGTLLVIKNYTGDLINFQVAEEMAQDEGLKVDHVVVNDDVALAKSTTATGRRGIAGTILVHKIAGAAAEMGKDLNEVKRIAEKVIANTATMGLGLSACTVPAAGKPGFTLPDNEIEMGLGIHGEPGIARVPLKPVKELVKDIVNVIKEEIQLSKGQKVAVIVNGMGATPLMELYIAAYNLKDELDALGLNIRYFKTGNYMTAIDMHGMSITISKLDDETEKLLKEPQDTLAW